MTKVYVYSAVKIYSVGSFLLLFSWSFKDVQFLKISTIDHLTSCVVSKRLFLQFIFNEEVCIDFGQFMSPFIRQGGGGYLTCLVSLLTVERRRLLTGVQSLSYYQGHTLTGTQDRGGCA